MSTDSSLLISYAGSVANVVIALANIILVCLVLWQTRQQRKFFQDQSLRDARTKISESWQRFASEMSNNPSAAPRYWPVTRFWPKADHGQMALLPAHMYMLNTLQHEYRFIEQGLHNRSNFEETLKYFIGVINNEEELSCVEAMARSVGFDIKFVELVATCIADRRKEIRVDASHDGSVAKFPRAS